MTSLHRQTSSWITSRQPLTSAGAALEDIVKSTVYMASPRREDLVSAWDIVRARMGGHPAPSTLLGVTVLGWPDQLVEVEAVAAVPADRDGGAQAP